VRPAGTAAGAHRYLLQAELQAAVMHHDIEELHQGGAWALMRVQARKIRAEVEPDGAAGDRVSERCGPGAGSRHGSSYVASVVIVFALLAALSNAVNEATQHIASTSDPRRSDLSWKASLATKLNDDDRHGDPGRRVRRGRRVESPTPDGGAPGPAGASPGLSRIAPG
jgi:hypothetical protein